jgi:hypothetical protein
MRIMSTRQTSLHAMTRAMNRIGLVVAHAAALVALGACKVKGTDKGESGAAATGSGSGSAVTTGSGSAATPTESTDAGAAEPSDADARSPGAKLLGVAAKFRCIGWSATQKVAACVTGQTMSNEPSVYELHYLGSQEPPTKLDTQGAEDRKTFKPDGFITGYKTLDKLEVQSLPETRKIVDKPHWTELGKGASLAWDSKQTNKGGPNQPPTVKHSVKVKCGKTSVDVLDSESEGVNPSFHTWNLGDHALIEMTVHTGLEGEHGEEVSALLVELATCKVVRSDKPASP